MTTCLTSLLSRLPDPCCPRQPLVVAVFKKMWGALSPTRSEHRWKCACLTMRALEATRSWAVSSVFVCICCARVCRILVWIETPDPHMWVCQNPTLSSECVAFNFEWRQMLCRLKLRQWKEPFLSTYRSMSSHSIRKSEAISTRLMTPFWKAGELWPQGRRIVGGGARKSTQTGWGISLTAFIMSAIYFFSVSSSNTSQIAYCGMLLNVLSLWSSV